MHKSAIRMLTLSRGAINADPGELVSLPSDQAAELVAAGYATTESDDGADKNPGSDAEPPKRQRGKGAPKGE